MKFRRQALHEVEAMQFHGFNGFDIQDWAFPHVAYCNDSLAFGEYLQVFYPNVILTAHRGSWILRDGDRYVVMTEKEFRDAGYISALEHGQEGSSSPSGQWEPDFSDAAPDSHGSHTLSQQVAALSQGLSQILSKIEVIMADMSTLGQQVHQNTSVIQSAIVLINGLKSQLEAAKNDPVAIQALIDELATNDQALATAVAANTASMPAPAPVVEPPATVADPAPVEVAPVPVEQPAPAPVVEEPAPEPIVEVPVEVAPTDAAMTPADEPGTV